MADQDDNAPIAPSGTSLGAAPGKPLSPEARRALEEAAARRKAAKASVSAAEIGGPKGAEPTRFGDWERGGRAVDFWRAAALAEKKTTTILRT